MQVRQVVTKVVPPIFINRDNNWWIIKQLTHVVDNTQGEGNGYYCDVILSNTLRDTSKALPSYDGSGSDKARFKTPTSPTFNPR